MSDVDETIVAIASPTTPAPRGAVRLSGLNTLNVLQQLGIDWVDTKSAKAISASLNVGAPLGDISVRVMVWPTRRSYTGQPSAEIHTFGSLPVLQAIVDTACRLGARPARPGEFTMRAFLAGRLDLTQAEAVLGVIDAQGRGSLDHALRQLSGNLSKPLEQLRSEMLNLLADVEAGLDFVDEDIEFVSDAVLVQRLGEIADQLIHTEKTMVARSGESSVSVIAIRGEPNAGKSRLLNTLAGDEVAIVADVAGTTRDTVVVDAMVKSLPVRFIDTAGIESHAGADSDALISQQSQLQAQRASDEARIRLWCVDSTRPDFDDAAQRLRIAANEITQHGTDIWIATKTDLLEKTAPANAVTNQWLATSSATGDGVESLKNAIADAITTVDAEETGSVVGTAARCRETLRQPIGAIRRAISLTQSGDGHEFVSAEIRLAVEYLGEVTGAVYTDDILDRVFSRFCIGK